MRVPNLAGLTLDAPRAVGRGGIAAEPLALTPKLQRLKVVIAAEDRIPLDTGVTPGAGGSNDPISLSSDDESMADAAEEPSVQEPSAENVQEEVLNDEPMADAAEELSAEELKALKEIIATKKAEQKEEKARLQMLNGVATYEQEFKDAEAAWRALKEQTKKPEGPLDGTPALAADPELKQREKTAHDLKIAVEKKFTAAKKAVTVALEGMNTQIREMQARADAASKKLTAKKTAERDATANVKQAEKDLRDAAAATARAKKDLERKRIDAGHRAKNEVARLKGLKVPKEMDDDDSVYNTMWDVIADLEETAKAEGELLRKETEEHEAKMQLDAAAAIERAYKCEHLTCEIHKMRQTLTEMGDDAQGIMDDIAKDKEKCGVTEVEMEWMSIVVEFAKRTQKRMEGLLQNESVDWQVQAHKTKLEDCFEEEEEEDQDEDQDGDYDAKENAKEDAKDEKDRKDDENEGVSEDSDDGGEEDFFDNRDTNQELTGNDERELQKEVKRLSQSRWEQANRPSGKRVVDPSAPSGPPQTLIPRKKPKGPAA